MKKLFFKCLLTALTFGALVSLNTTAAETAETDAPNSIIIDEESNNIALSSENAAQDGINAIKMSLQVSSDDAAEISFKFDRNNSVKVADFRYHEDTGTLNIYMADSEPIFTSDTLNLGTVSAKNAEGQNVDVDITVPENALSFASQNTVTEKTFNVNDVQDSKNSNKINGEGKSLNVQKTFDENYIITIPESTENLTKGQKLTASVDNVLIKHGQTLRLSVTSENDWTLRNRKYPDTDSGAEYRICGENMEILEEKTETILTVGSGKKSDSVTLTVDSIEKPTFAGTYTDTLTFSVEVS